MFGFGRQLSTSISFSPLVNVPLVTPSKLTPEIANCDSRPWRAKPNYDLKPTEGTQISNNAVPTRKNSQIEKLVLSPFETPKLQEKPSLQNQLDAFKKEGIHDEDHLIKKKLSQSVRYLEENDELFQSDNDEISMETPNLLDPNYSIVDLDDYRFFGGLGLSSIEDSSVDYVITTNINNNLHANINVIFREAWRILKNGGEICFSGQFSNLKVKNVFDTNHFVLKPFYLEDIRRSLYNNGFVCYQTLKSDELCFERTEETSKDLLISHKTLNSFKIETLEDCAEDYGQFATYKGTFPGQIGRFILDIKNSFPIHHPTRISGNTAEILLHSRYNVHFDVSKILDHRGPFIS